MASTSPWERVRILLIAANHGAAEAATSLLEETGARVLRASSWPAAVVLLSDVRVDAVLALDGGLELDALDLARRLRALPPPRGGSTPLVLPTFDELPASADDRTWAVRPTALETMLATLQRAAHMP